MLLCGLGISVPTQPFLYHPLVIHVRWNDGPKPTKRNLSLRFEFKTEAIESQNNCVMSRTARNS